MTRRPGAATWGATFLLITTSPMAQAQQSPTGSGRCDDAVITGAVERTRRLPSPPAMLYDGRAPLAKAPTRPIAIPADVVAAIPACVLLSVVFAEQGGAWYVQDAGYMTASGPGMAVRGRGAALAQAGTGILREMLQQQLLPAPRPGARYLVAIPIARDHPLYAPRDAVVATGAEQGGAARAAPVLGRGYHDARFLGERGGIQAYLIAERGDRYWFALVRPLRPDDAVLDFGAESAAGRVTLGGQATSRFDEVILPHIRETGAKQVMVEVRHYAAGTSVAYQPGSAYALNEMGTHPLTGSRVEVPVGVERWRGQRQGSTGPFAWLASETAYSEHNSIAAIQAVQASRGAQVAATDSMKAVRDAAEAARVREARARMDERERRKPALYAAAGLTYRPASYWSSFEMSRTLRMIYDGYYPDARADWVFGRTYFRAVTTYGDKCRALLPPGSAMRIDSRFTRDDLLGWMPGRVDTIFIHPDYKHVFRGWHEQRPGFPVTTPPEASAAGMLNNPGAGATAALEVGRVKDALKADVEQLFREECTSGVIRQFMENLRRLGNGEPTLQAQRVPETLPRPDDAPTTVGEACMRYDRENGHPRNARWCGCLDRELTPRYRADDLARVLENYSRFIERVSYPPTGGGTRVPPPEYLAANVCRQR